MPIRGSRSLLLPGHQPPLSHLGATLLRHVIGAGLRYSLYHLGLDPPESPPVRIHRLRLHLDASALDQLLEPHPAGAELRAALLDPAGTATEPLPLAFRTTTLFHRTRLRIQQRRGSPAPNQAVPEQNGFAPFRKTLSAAIPRLGDAFLAEILAVLDRRQARREGASLGPVMSTEAARFLAGSTPRLSCLGPPDLLTGSWAAVGAPPLPSDTGDTTSETTGAQPHPLRGRFREHYRHSLDSLRPLYLSLAEQAVSNRLLARRDDAFFIPLDLASDLDSESKPSWLEAAVAANRLEYETELGKPAAPEVLTAGHTDVSRDLVALGGSAPDWTLAPLSPLP